MKIYVTLGQDHRHTVNGTTYDCDSLVEVDCESHEHGRHIVFEVFGGKFCTSYEAEYVPDMKYFPRGVIPLQV